MSLLPITEAECDVEIQLAYATSANFTGQPIYRRARCYLHAASGRRAAARRVAGARGQGYRLQLFDAYRPTEAQWVMWNHTPDPEFLADPRRGSPHSRGVAVDLTLLDRQGRELDMGTGFDAFTPLSHHGSLQVSVSGAGQSLHPARHHERGGLGLLPEEWWHYQLFDSRQYPALQRFGAAEGLM